MFEWELPCFGPHVCPLGSQLMALFGKVVEPIGGGASLGEESHWVGVVLKLSTSVLLPSHSLMDEYRCNVISQPLALATIVPTCSSGVLSSSP